MIYLVGNTKGGVGKTNTAILLAGELALSGREVLLIDGDRQRTAEKALSLRADAELSPGIACASYHEGATLRGQVQLQKGKYDDIVIDAGGRDSTALRAGMSLCDILLIPFEPRNFEVWALDDMVALIDEVNAVRDGMRVYAFLNRAEPGVLSTDNREAAAAVSEYPQITYLPTRLVRRKAFSNAAGLGRSVSEMKPVDAKASSELKALVAALV